MAAGRNRPHVLSLGDPQPPLLGRAPPHPSDDRIRAVLLEDRLAAQHREIHVLLADNQQLAATHVALGQEVGLARHELRVAAATAERVERERDAEVREAYERAMRVEAEARLVERMRAELGQVRADVREMEVGKEEMGERLKGLRGELGRARAEVQRVPMMRKEIENMQVELQKGRAAVEYERKAHTDNLEQCQAMEKNMMAMAQVIEKLHAELANAEKRARAAAAAAAAANPGPGYATNYGNPEMTYGGMQYPNMYNMQQVQVQAVADGGAHYGSGAVSHGGQYDLQHSHAPR